MPELVGYLLLFTGVGVAFVLVNLTVGWFLRPSKMDAEKGTIYECGEPTIGSAWVQFDLRFYVVALLFVIFDVEMAFFFPWAVVFGRSNQLADPRLPPAERLAITRTFLPPPAERGDASKVRTFERFETFMTVDASRATATDIARGLTAPQITGDLPKDRERLELEASKVAAENAQAASDLAWLAFGDILVFFGVLLVGFAYLWRRGDLDWVRSLAGQKAVEAAIARDRQRELAVLTKD
jgi:NADH-quinone oxidoreductase subunit A